MGGGGGRGGGDNRLARIVSPSLSPDIPHLFFSSYTSVFLSRLDSHLLSFFTFLGTPVYSSLDFLPRPTSVPSRSVIRVVAAPSAQKVHVVFSVFYELRLVQTRRNVVPRCDYLSTSASHVLTIYRCNNDTLNLNTRLVLLKSDVYFLPSIAFLFLFHTTQRLKLFHFSFFFKDFSSVICKYYMYHSYPVWAHVNSQLYKTSNVY